jgi:hypothetical protein
MANVPPFPAGSAAARPRGSRHGPGFATIRSGTQRRNLFATPTSLGRKSRSAKLTRPAPGESRATRKERRRAVARSLSGSGKLPMFVPDAVYPLRLTDMRGRSRRHFPRPTIREEHRSTLRRFRRVDWLAGRRMRSLALPARSAGHLGASQFTIHLTPNWSATTPKASAQ